MGNPDVYLDITVDGHPLGRIVLHLFDSVAPATARNFRELCTGEHGFGYKDSAIHRINPQFMIQGGDITNGDGTGGRSIYGSSFPDESFEVRHDRPGLLSMGSRGPGTNSSQFFITTSPAPWCDDKHVVFGQVVDAESMETVKRIQSYSSDHIWRRPSRDVRIVRCGVM
ncbi:Der f Mal f 6 allergen [Stereum hirsutum FP-91666 SS1]|uniref:Der f Mal f 6 allergen n=1 Tax=Stereum hirsutum (strain FP-91666) TaxID=721885 RepID=UPI0004449882|nr:Der f Mal f 6 allergen [Stereum hirsutum FP-91666 SS1]EIM84105.1 Der f Mal f 6 allergen [Stereum hirsutum FP-91666 SS1]